VNLSQALPHNFWLPVSEFCLAFAVRSNGLSAVPKP
jgi:hypothetical protein